jgi:broad specificity phosphatase PhoE
MPRICGDPRNLSTVGYWPAMTRTVVLAALLLASTALAQAPAPEAVWDALRAPGAVVVLRHSYAPGGFDPPDSRLDDCATQRNLDASGRAQARRLGEAFRARGIVVGTVLSSPRCRCLDTGRLAFGGAQAWPALQGALGDRELRARLAAEVRQRIAAHRDGPPLVLVTHGSVVVDLTGRDVRMGELVVLHLDVDGDRSVAGQLYVQ